MAEKDEQARQETFRRMLSAMKPIFWDTDLNKLDVDRNSGYIISRLLNHGGMPGFIYMEELYEREAIVEAVTHRRDLRPKVRNFMLNWYHIPREAVKVTYQPWR